MILFAFFSLLGAYFLIFHLFRFAIDWWKMYQQIAPIPGTTLFEALHCLCKINLCNQKSCAKESNDFFTQNGAKYGGKYGLFKVPSLKLFIVICDAQLARKVLTCGQFGNVTLLQRFLSTMVTVNGLLTCGYEQSKKVKQTFQSHFSFSSIERYIAQAEKHLARFSLKVEEEFILKNNGHCANVLPHIANLAFDIVGETLFGVQFNAQKLPDEHRMVQQMHPILGFADRFVAQQWKYLSDNVLGNALFSLFDLKLFTETLPAAKQVLLHRFSICQMILSRIKERKNDGIRHDRQSLLDTAIKDGNLEEKPDFPFNWSRLLEAQGHMTTFMFAAQDSVRTTTSWLLLELAHNPKVQSKVQQEIDDFFAANGKPRNLFALNRLHYLDCCFLETIRLAPIAPYVSRTTNKPFLLQTKGGSVTIPENIPVLIDFQLIHQQEENFSQADQFIPERFLVFPKETSDSSDKANIPIANKDAFFPFGHGVRSCFGQRYGQMLVKLIIFNLLRQFTVRPVEGSVKPRPVHSIFQQAAHFPLHFARRTF